MIKPHVPEPKYFLKDICKIEEYKKMFPDNCDFRGEKSVCYFENDAVDKISQMFPDPKIIISLRNPKHRCLSNYFYSVRNGLETRTLEEVFLDKKDPPKTEHKFSMDPFDYINRSFYYENLKKHLHLSPLIVFFEDFTSNFSRINDITSFIGCNATLKKESPAANKSHWTHIPADVDLFLTNLFKNEKEILENLLGKNIPW